MVVRRRPSIAIALILLFTAPSFAAPKQPASAPVTADA
jgi:hypothetical protein